LCRRAKATILKKRTMKNVMKLIAACLVFAGAMQTSCTSASEKVEKSAENVTDADVKLE
jgi:hypothetical protein